MPHGWDESAKAWIDVIGEDGDWGRRHVLDAPMLARVQGRGFRRAVDIGCGEGRFCRMLGERGVQAIGVDPTRVLIDRARALDGAGDYRIGRAEALDLPDASMDLAVFYLSLIDIAGLAAAVAEAGRVLKPGGTVLVANLQSFNTAADPAGWTREPDGSRRFCIDGYLDERVVQIGWRGVSIQNWHRPLGVYMSAFLDAGFTLVHFSEPEPTIGGEKADRYRRAPNFLIMEWRKAG